MIEKVELIISKWAQGSSYCSEQEKGNVVNHLTKLIEDLYKDVQELKTEIEIIKSYSSVIGKAEAVTASALSSKKLNMEKLKC